MVGVRLRASERVDSEERVALVRSLYDAFSRRDIPAILRVLSPDVEWGEPENPYNPAAGTRRGHSGFLEWLRIGRESEEILDVTIDRILTDDVGVAVAGRTRCRVRSTGRTYATEFVHLISFEGARIVRFRELFDTFAAAEAFRAD